MILAKKVRIKPTSDQEKQLWKSSGVSRWAYNWALNRQMEHYEEHRKQLCEQTLRKQLTQLKQTEKYAWLYDVSNNITKQAIKDLCKAYSRYITESKKKGYRYKKSSLKKKAKDTSYELTPYDFEGHPRFKTRKKSEPKFYNDTEKLKVKGQCVLIEKVGWVTTSERLPMNVDYTNPRISYDGKYWYISVGVEEQNEVCELTDESLGIDVGIKELAVCSNGMRFKNINKTKTVKRIGKRLRKLQRSISRKYEMNKEGRRFVKTCNIVKVEKKIRHLHRRLKHIRLNHVHQSTTSIVKTKPRRIVMETLNIRGMMKNKHLSKAIQEQKLYDFKRILKYKVERIGTEWVEADRRFPSSKMGSCCGWINKDLKLSDRIFKCVCGEKIDRDYNASINLSRYKMAN